MTDWSGGGARYASSDLRRCMNFSPDSALHSCLPTPRINRIRSSESSCRSLLRPQINQGGDPCGQPPWFWRYFALFRQRIGSDLELHDLALGPLAALNVPDKVRPVVGVQGTALPAAVGIVDAAIHTARIEAERIRDAEIGPLIGLRVQRDQSIRV